jgi:hypothetical protein
LKAFVCAQARELEKVFDEFLDAGRFLFLCDALNEMAEYRADSPQVRLLTEWIETFGEREGKAPAAPMGSAGASPSQDIALRIRIAAAEMLGELGDPRFPVDERTGLILPPMVDIPAVNKFTMGCASDDIKRYTGTDAVPFPCRCTR